MDSQVQQQMAAIRQLMGPISRYAQVGSDPSSALPSLDRPAVEALQNVCRVVVRLEQVVEALVQAHGDAAEPSQGASRSSGPAEG